MFRNLFLPTRCHFGHWFLLYTSFWSPYWHFWDLKKIGSPVIYQQISFGFRSLSLLVCFYVTLKNMCNGCMKCCYNDLWGPFDQLQDRIWLHEMVSDYWEDRLGWIKTGLVGVWMDGWLNAVNYIALYGANNRTMTLGTDLWCAENQLNLNPSNVDIITIRSEFCDVINEKLLIYDPHNHLGCFWIGRILHVYLNML